MFGLMQDQYVPCAAALLTSYRNGSVPRARHWRWLVRFRNNVSGELAS